jgi:transposase
LGLIEQLERTVGEFDAQIERAIQPFRGIVEWLTTIPGISRVSAQGLVGEIGVEMDRFPTVGHLVSWAGLCPRLDESAGKHRSTRVRKASSWLKPLLVQCAWAATRSKDTYLQAQYLRLKARRGPKKAVVAVAASILTAAYHLIRDGQEYRDLGHDYFTRRDSDRIAQRLAKRIRQLGYEVQIIKAA